MGDTFSVATTGSDANPGTAAKPWKTIQHGCSTAPSGSTVIVHGGTYTGRVIFSRPLTLVAGAGEKVLIDGTGVAIPDSDSGLVLINGISNVTLSGFEIANYKTTNSQLCPIGIFVEGQCSGVQILNNYVHNIENDGTDASSINALGIAVYGNSAKGAITQLTISGNQVAYTKTGSSETVTINGNVNGFTVTKNSIHDVNNIGIDCIGYEGTSPIAAQDRARNGLVAQNVVSNVTSAKNPAYQGDVSADGIYVDGGTNIVIERNTISRADLGCEVTSEHGGKVADSVIVRNNLILMSQVVGISIGGYDPTRGGTTNCTFVNNTLFHNDTTNSGSGQFQIQYHTTGNLFANNILVATDAGELVNASLSTGVKLDYNLYCATQNAEWDWASGSYTTLADFVRATGNDKHSLFANPLFNTRLKGNYHLTAGSPALKKGYDYGASILGAYDLDGNPRVVNSLVDLGCYETVAPRP